MKTSELKELINQMKFTSVPSRMIYIWRGKAHELDDIFKGIEVHRANLALIAEKYGLTEIDATRDIEQHLNETTTKYERERNEPSVLIIDNAILLARYNCELTAILKYGISPRSAIILVFPKRTSASLPHGAERWIKNDTTGLVEKIGRQLGDPRCIIDDSGDTDE